MDNDQTSLEFWSTILKSLTDFEPKDDLHRHEINSPIVLMSTSMAIDIAPEPSNALGSGDKARPEAVAELGDKNINEDRQRSTGKQIEKANEEGETEEMKNLRKRKRQEARNLVEKRRRTAINTNIDKLAEMIGNCKKGDISTTLDCIIDSIRSMQLCVEVTKQRMGPMFPLGMHMNFPAPAPAPWFPYYMYPSFIMPLQPPPPPPFSGYIREANGGNQQIVPVTAKGFNNQPQQKK